MLAWVRGAALGQAEFAERFLGRAGDDPVARELRAAAAGATLAKSHAALAEAAKHLANAMQSVGLDRWQRFLADAQERARDPATVAAVGKSRQAADIEKSRRDAIRSVPFGPVEAISGVGPAILAGKSVAAAARAAGAAILGRALPKTGPQNGEAAVDLAAAARKAEEPSTAPTKSADLTKPSLPANPDDLVHEGWQEISNPKQMIKGYRNFMNQKTRQIVEFHKGRVGESGWRGRDHYHISNPTATGKVDRYLDVNGRPVADGSKPSHIPPGR